MAPKVAAQPAKNCNRPSQTHHSRTRKDQYHTQDQQRWRQSWRRLQKDHDSRTQILLGIQVDDVPIQVKSVSIHSVHSVHCHNKINYSRSSISRYLRIMRAKWEQTHRQTIDLTSLWTPTLTAFVRILLVLKPRTKPRTKWGKTLAHDLIPVQTSTAALNL
jgi:hypothetical protein